MRRMTRPRLLAAMLGGAALIGAAFTGAGAAQEQTGAPHWHEEAAQDEPMDHAGMGHAQMDHAQMDHATMGHAMPAPSPGGDADGFESRMNADMATMMRDMHAPGYTGDRDIDFLAMMIPHHQGAVDMAKLVLEHGADPLTRSLAEEIIASQQVEIEAMRARLEILRAAREDGATADEEYPALTGVRGAGVAQ